MDFNEEARAALVLSFLSREVGVRVNGGEETVFPSWARDGADKEMLSDVFRLDIFISVVSRSSGLGLGESLSGIELRLAADLRGHANQKIIS